MNYVGIESMVIGFLEEIKAVSSVVVLRYHQVRHDPAITANGTLDTVPYSIDTMTNNE